MLKVDKKWNVFDVVLGFLIDNTRFGSSTIGKITQDITNRVKNISTEIFDHKLSNKNSGKLLREN